jgi:hypothetical protein
MRTSTLAFLATALLITESIAAPAADPSSTSPTLVTRGELSSKRGLPYNDVKLLKGFTGPGSKASWTYNWASKSGGAPTSLHYVPMMHGLDSAGSFAADAAGATHLLYINEPDVAVDKGGVNTSPQAAADGYTKHMMPFKGKAKISSPAVSNGVSGGPQGAMGIPYLKDFFSKCRDCHFDFVAFHWYGNNFAELKKHVEDVKAAVKDVPGVVKDGSGNPALWITEFGLNGGNPETISKFLEEAMPYLDKEPSVQRYAYQWVAEGSLVTGGQPNKGGKTFAGLA